MSQTTPDPFGAISITRPDAPVQPQRDVSGAGHKHPQTPRSPHHPFPRQALPPAPKRPFSLALVLTLLTGVTLVYLACGYLAVPYLIKTNLAQALSRRLDRPVTIGQVEFSPLSLRLTLINGIVGPRLSDPGDKVDPILSFATLALDLEALSLPRRAFICREVTLDQPFIHLVHDQENRYNLATLLPATDQAGPRSIPGLLATLLGQRYSLNNIAITKGEVIYDDLPAAKVHRLQEVTVSLPAIGNISRGNGPLISTRQGEEGEFTPRISALVNGTPIRMDGQAQMEKGAVTARLNLKMTDLALAAYNDYLPPRLEVQDLRGQADLDLDLLYDTSQAEQLRLMGSITLRNAEVEAKPGRFTLESGLLKGWLAPFGNRFHAEEITLRRPLWQRPAGEQAPWPGLVAALLTPAPDHFNIMRVDHLQITGGEIRGATPPPPGQGSDWQGIDLSSNTTPLSTADPDGQQQAIFSLNAHTAAGTSVNLQASASTPPLAAKGLLVVNKVDLATVQEVGRLLGASLPAGQGVVEQLQTNFSLTAHKDQGLTFTLAPLSIQAKDLRVAYNGQLLEAPVWQSEQGSFDPAAPILHLGRVRLQQARLTCRRQSSDASWHTLLTPAAEGRATPPGPVAAQGFGSIAPQGVAKGIPLDLEAIDLSNGSLVIENQGPPDITLHLERFDLQVDELDPKQANSVTAAAMLDDKFPIQATGSFSLAPFTASLNIQANDLPLASFKPVLERYVERPLTGNLSVNGTLSLPALSYQGQWAITSLSAPPISCRKLNGEGTSFTLRPLALAIDQLTLEGPALQVTANDNGFPEYPTIMRPGWQPAPTADAAAVAIKAIDVDDGSLIYDFPGPPGLTIGHQKIQGTFTDFVVAKGQSIPFDLSGVMEGRAEFKARGRISPFASQPGLTLTGRVEGLPLTTLAPILEPHWGFTIRAGTLDFDNALTYENTLIQDACRLAFHDLVLGKPLAAPAIKAIGNTWQSLPLAQAVLQDAAGAITVTVPIDGRTDTGFTYLQGVKTFLNQLLLKASVSPINLLSDHQKGLADTVEFAPGSDRLTSATEAQLHELADLLQDRPLLALTLTGHADGTTDSRALLRAKKGAAAKGKGEVNDEALLALATRRSRMVRDYLAERGVPRGQLQIAPPELITSGKAGRTGRRVVIGLQVAK